MQQDELIVKLTSEESERDLRWAEDVVRLMSTNLHPVMTKDEYDKGHDILFGVLNKEHVDRLFSGAAMKAIKDKLSGANIYFFEKIRNAIIDERVSANLNVTVNSLDPEKDIKKAQDKSLLKNRKGIEALANEVTANNGMPPFKIKGDDFHGNVDDFDAANMDDLDEENVTDFFDSKWGLQSEMILQDVLNPVLRINQIARKYDRYINDILIGLTVCSQVYVDEIEGKIKVEDLRPYELQVLAPTGENDEKGAQGFSVTKSTTLRGFLRKFGDSFSLADNYKDLLRTVDGSNNWTGICEGDNIVMGAGPLNTCVNLNRFLDSNISYSISEVRVINGNTRARSTDINGNYITRPLADIKDATEQDGWSTETKYKEDTYRFYHLQLNATSPKILRWGKLYMQPTEGVYDEYSGFSFMVNRRKGVPIVEILKPFHTLIQVSFMMFEMLVNDVKPDGYIFNYDSLIKVAEHYKDAKDAPADVKSAISNLLQQFQNSPNMMTTTPTDDKDEPMGGDAFGVKKKENGLNKAAEDLMKIMDWCEQKATDFMGTQGIDLAEAKDGFKLSLENRKRSRASTAFIDTVLLSHIEDQAITLLSYAQDISKYPDIPAYKYLESLVGTLAMKFMKSMKKSPHRYGVFLDTFNNDIQLAELRQMAQQDHANQRISLEQYAFVVSFENIKEAVFYLAQERKKADKKRQKEQQSLAQQKMQEQEAELQRAMKLEDLKGKWRAASEDKRSAGFVQAAEINGRTQIAAKQLQEDGQDKRLAASANNEIAKITENANTQAQKAVPL